MDLLTEYEKQLAEMPWKALIFEFEDTIADLLMPKPSVSYENVRLIKRELGRRLAVSESTMWADVDAHNRNVAAGKCYLGPHSGRPCKAP